MAIIVPEGDLSFGAFAQPGGPYMPAPPKDTSGIPVEIAFNVFDESGVPLRDPSRSFYYEYEVWAYSDETKKTTAVSGKGTSNYDPKDPPGLVRFKAGAVPHDTAFNPGGVFTLKFLPEGQQPRIENYLPIMNRVTVYYHKLPAPPAAPIFLQWALEGKKQDYEKKAQDSTGGSETLTSLLVVGAILVGAYFLLPLFFKRKPEAPPQAPALPEA